MTNEEWIAAGRPHWQCAKCKGIFVTISWPDDFICGTCNGSVCKQSATEEDFKEWFAGNRYNDGRYTGPLPDPILIYDNDKKMIMRMDRSGNVELWGDVNEAALRFWTAVCQLSGGQLTHSRKELRPKSTIKICCHGCSEFHEFNIETLFLYSCTHGTAYSHPPLEELHELTDGTYADPEQWYKFSKELWGSYLINTKGYGEKTGNSKTTLDRIASNE